MTRRDRLRVLLACGFIAAGLLHLISPRLYRPIMPAYLPAHDLLIAISGVAEIAGGIGLLVPGLRRFAGWGLLLLLLAVFPANVEMLRLYRSRGVVWWGEALLWLRLPFQLVLAWWVRQAAQERAVRAEAPVYGD
ncbi:MAG: DoxX family protein [Gemmatimonadota bacterium]